MTPAQLLVALAGLGGLWFVVRALRKRAAASTHTRSTDALDPPLPCFERLSSLLERRGLARAKSEPLERFARRLDEAGLADAGALVDRYAALRYGGVGQRSTLETDMERFVGGAHAPS